MRLRTKMLLVVACLLTLSTQAQASPYRATSIVGSDTLLIGDSHTWLSGLNVYPGWDIDADPGRASTEGLQLVQQYLTPTHQVIVFDLATNDFKDPATFLDDIRKVFRLSRPRQLVFVEPIRSVPYVNQPGCLEGNRAEQVASVLQQFVSGHPGRTRLINFASVVKATPSYYGADCVHFTTEGYKLRSLLVRYAAALAQKRYQRMFHD